MAYSPSKVSLKQWVGHRAREVLLWPAILRKAQAKVAFIPSSGGAGSAQLRAVLVARQLRRMGWNAVCIPPQLERVQRERYLKWLNPDILVFQKCRHPLNDAQHAFGFRYILDIDDADFHDVRLQSRMEATATGAAGVIAGSRYIETWARQFNQNCQIVWTGTPISKGARPAHAERGVPVVTWAQSSPLGYRAELEFVARVLRGVAARDSGFSLRLYGVNSDEDARAVRKVIGLDGIRIETLPSLAYDRFLASLRSVSVGLSPIVAEAPFSRGKSFGKILGYLDAKVPVVCSDHADHALFFTGGSGFVGNDEGAWQTCIVDLIRNAALRDAVADRAFADFTRRLSLERATDLVGGFIKAVI